MRHVMMGGRKGEKEDFVDDGLFCFAFFVMADWKWR